MATTFPEEIDSFLNPQPADSVAAVSHAAQHSDANDAIEALQQKVGVDNSTDTTSLDYKIRHAVAQEEIQDFVAPLLNHAFHTNITVTYDDVNNRIVLQGNAGGGGGASVIISPNPPSSPGSGDIWLDSDNAKTYIWDGAYWIEVGGSSSQAVAAVNSVPPTSPILGSIWMNSSTARTYIYDGAFWAQV